LGHVPHSYDAEKAMAYGFARRERPSLHPAAEPNVIPFIDVLLVLLIIFMVTAPKPTTDLRVDMPRHTSGPASLIEPTIVHLRGSAKGYAVFVGSGEVALTEIGAGALAHILAANPVISAEDAHAEARVFVRSELEVAYAPVVAVVESLQQAGFRNVSIIAQNADDA